MTERDETSPELRAELQRARQQIAELEGAVERYRALVENAGESIVVVQDGKLVFHNPAFEQMVTVAPTEFQALPFVAFVHPDDRTALAERYLQMLQGEPGPGHHEFRTITPAGATRWYAIRGCRIRWQSRPALLCTLAEITAQRQAHSALRESEEKYRLLVQSAPAAIYEVDLTNDRFLSVNDLMCEYLGYTRAELMATKPTDILGERSRELVAERMERRRRGEPVPPTVEFQARTKDGRDIWVLLNMKVMSDDDGTLRAAVVAHDITARRQLDAEIQNVQKLESLGVLAGGIAHDFSNLLTGILGSISLAKRAARDPIAVVEHCDAAATACARAKRLTQQLLTFSEGGAPARQPAPVRRLVEESTLLALGGGNVTFELNVPDETWPVDVDEGQIAQVLSNLAINARQAMPAGGTLQIEARNAELAAGEELPLQSGRYVRLAMTDRGHGIAPQNLPKIFDPFFTTKQTGTGLGLTAAHSIVQRHGGHLTVESVLDVGSTFILYLPAARPAEPLRDQPELVGRTRLRRALLMDDDVVVRRVGQQMLTELGFDVVSVRDGAEAIERCREAQAAGEPFDVALLDLIIRRGMGGADAIIRLREVQPLLLAIAASGYSADPVLADPQRHSFDAALRKPYSVDELAAVLSTLHLAAEQRHGADQPG